MSYYGPIAKKLDVKNSLAHSSRAGIAKALKPGRYCAAAHATIGRARRADILAGRALAKRAPE